MTERLQNIINDRVASYNKERIFSPGDVLLTREAVKKCVSSIDVFVDACTLFYERRMRGINDNKLSRAIIELHMRKIDMVEELRESGYITEECFQEISGNAKVMNYDEFQTKIDYIKKYAPIIIVRTKKPLNYLMVEGLIKIIHASNKRGGMEYRNLNETKNPMFKQRAVDFSLKNHIGSIPYDLTISLDNISFPGEDIDERRYEKKRIFYTKSNILDTPIDHRLN